MMAIDPVTGAYKPDTPTPWIGSQPVVANDSVASQVTALASKDSELNRMAATEGLKAANRRGLLNSSMAVGASQDAVLKNLMPIATQDAGQNFLKNQAAKAFEYGMTAQDDTQAFTTGERLGTQGFTSAEAKALRDWQTSEALAGRNWQTGERIGTQGWQTGERLGTQEWQSGEALAGRMWQTGERLGTQDFTTRERLGAQSWESDEQALNRALETALQNGRITSAEKVAFAQMRNEKGIAEAANALHWKEFSTNLNFLVSQNKLDRAQATALQNDAQAFDATQNLAVRNLQDKIAKMNLSGTMQTVAAQAISTAANQYQVQFNTIMANPDLSATARAEQLTGAQNRYSNQMKLFEDFFDIDIQWN
jgi:hypothetical protein